MSKKSVDSVLPQEGFVRLPVVIKLLGIGKTSWWCGIKEGRFPKPVKLGPRTSAWRVEDIRALFTSFADNASDKKTDAL
jgi:predicted DNA-binding transcriptional regulator AlpA